MSKKGLVVLNYAPASSAVSPDSVPTLVPKDKMTPILAGDTEPFYKVESIAYPVKGTGGIYLESFFESFVSIMNDRPIPGSKRGHSYESRPTSDLYTVGGKLDRNGDGSGTVHMKVYIPKEGDSDSNVGLIRDAKANIVHFSLVTWPEFTVTRDEDDNEIRQFTASKGYERNDAVEYGAGAMGQEVNSEGRELPEGFFTEAKALIEENRYDARSTSTESQPIRGGVVYRSALRRLASSADGQDRADLASLISMIDKRSKGAKRMNKEEALALLRNLRENGELTLMEVANAINLENQVVTESMKNAAATVAELTKLGVTDPVATFKSMSDTIKKTEKDRVENRLKAEFDKTGLGDKNLLFVHAKKALGNTTEADLDKAIEDFKADPVSKNLAGQMADVLSKTNQLGESESNQNQSVAFGKGATLEL